MVFYTILTHLVILLGIVFVQEFLSIRFNEEDFFPLYPVWIENVSNDRLTEEALGVTILFLIMDLLLIAFIQKRIKRIQKNLE